jgi:hypothetical protein
MGAQHDWRGISVSQRRGGVAGVTRSRQDRPARGSHTWFLAHERGKWGTTVVAAPEQSTVVHSRARRIGPSACRRTPACQCRDRVAVAGGVGSRDAVVKPAGTDPRRPPAAGTRSRQDRKNQVRRAHAWRLPAAGARSLRNRKTPCGRYHYTLFKRRPGRAAPNVVPRRRYPVLSAPLRLRAMISSRLCAFAPLRLCARHFTK